MACDRAVIGRRDKKCHYVIRDPELEAVGRLNIISKRHFWIFKDGNIVFIEDRSNNGTFLNGSKIGQNKKLPLVNDAVLALAEPSNKVLMLKGISNVGNEHGQVLMSVLMGVRGYTEPRAHGKQARKAVYEKYIC